MQIKQLYFRSGPGKLFGALFIPTFPKKNKGFVVCHPPFEEKKSSQRTFFDMSYALTEKGYHVLMFDFYACGDSEGDFLETDLFIWQNNINDAIDFLKAEAEIHTITIIALRLSATLGLMSVFHRNDAINLILIEPISSYVKYLKVSLKQKLIKELLTSGVISADRDELLDKLNKGVSLDFDGYEITQNFYLSSLSLDKQLAIPNRSALSNITILSIVNKRKTLGHVQVLQSFLPETKFEMIEVNGVDQFWAKLDDVEYKNLTKNVLTLADKES